MAATGRVTRFTLEFFALEIIRAVELISILTDKRWDIATQVQQRMPFDGGFVPPEPSPWKPRKTQIDGGVHRVQTCIQIDANFVVAVQRPRDTDQDLREIREGPQTAKARGMRFEVTVCSTRGWKSSFSSMVITGRSLP